jgi:hypothetical protein
MWFGLCGLGGFWGGWGVDRILGERGESDITEGTEEKREHGEGDGFLVVDGGYGGPGFAGNASGGANP